jgi:type IV pilus assembly protein PilA
MKNTLRAMKAKRAEGDSGFTLIELLVVVVIIGILVAIAIPVYLNYREGAADKSAQSDVRGAIGAVEQFYTQNNSKLPDSVTGTGTTLTLTYTGTPAPNQIGKIPISDAVTLGYMKHATDGSYKICAKNTGGSGATYLYNSSTGGSVKQATTAIANFATCV